MSSTSPSTASSWPVLPYEAWKDTCKTLHMWTQVVGKVRLALAHPVNHWWHVPLYITASGLTTSPMPHDQRIFQIDFDLIEHRLLLQCSDGSEESFELRPMTVADFYSKTMDALHALKLDVKIWTTPVEVPDAIPFEQDTVHTTYDPVYANRFWQVLVHSEPVFEAFRSSFLGKSSPLHFFWGSFDLALTRFSGRRAPVHPGAPHVSDRVTREAYSHEVSSCGFWPGGDAFPQPVFYSYAYPEPPGFKQERARPASSYYASEMGEFLLPYEAVRTAALPEKALLEFLESTYAAAADLGKWDRAALERKEESAA